MSYWNDLCDTYDFNIDKVSIYDKNPLIPISHILQKVKYEVVIHENGTIESARTLSKEEQITMIPCTAASSSRTSIKIAPHPLVDKLRYIARDAKEYENSKDREHIEKYHEAYMDILGNWNRSKFKHNKICAVEKLLKNVDLCKYMLEQGFISQSASGQIKEINESVRFVVLNEKEFEEDEERTYLNKNIFNSYIEFYREKKQEEPMEVSYISGNLQPDAEFAPKKIRHMGDNTKLISFNDTTGFTYRGRFPDKNAAFFVGYEDVQKSHSALQWLIRKQGFTIGQTTIVAWEKSGIEIPSIMNSSIDIAGYEELFTIEDKTVFTNENYANILRRVSNGYKDTLPENANVIILGLNSFADKGRLSICLYESSKASEYVDRVLRWQDDLMWTKKSTKNRRHYMYAFPSPRDISTVICGKKADDDRVIKKQILRIINCIIYDHPFPYDLLKIIVNNASDPKKYSKEEYDDVLFVACSVIKKYYNDKTKGNIKMSLDKTNKSRSYLYGRLLGAAQKIEEIAVYQKNKSDKVTNAEIFMGRYRRVPVQTWATIRERITPYINQLKANGGNYYLKELKDIYELVDDVEDFSMNKPLDETYLIGYYHEMNSYFKESGKEGEQ